MSRWHSVKEAIGRLVGRPTNLAGASREEQLERYREESRKRDQERADRLASVPPDRVELGGMLRSISVFDVEWIEIYPERGPPYIVRLIDLPQRQLFERRDGDEVVVLELWHFGRTSTIEHSLRSVVKVSESYHSRSRYDVFEGIAGHGYETGRRERWTVEFDLT